MTVNGDLADFARTFSSENVKNSEINFSVTKM
jgi:hypothetical protein